MDLPCIGIVEGEEGLAPDEDKGFLLSVVLVGGVGQGGPKGLREGWVTCVRRYTRSETGTG